MQNRVKIIILALLVLTGLVTNFSFGNNAEPPKVNIEGRIPLLVAGYQGSEKEIPERVFKLINPEEIVMRTYKKGDSEINLAAVVSENRDNLHAPEICYKLQGFRFLKESSIKLNDCCKISRVDTVREDKPYVFHFYYTDMERVYTSRAELIKNMVISRVLNKPRKKYALVLAFTEVSNEDDLRAFSGAVNEAILKKNRN